MAISEKKIQIKTDENNTKLSTHKFTPEHNKHIEVILMGEFSESEIFDLKTELNQSLAKDRHSVMVDLVMRYPDYRFLFGNDSLIVIEKR
jgi:hypothetical protein